MNQPNPLAKSVTYRVFKQMYNYAENKPLDKPVWKLEFVIGPMDSAMEGLGTPYTFDSLESLYMFVHKNFPGAAEVNDA